MTKWLNRRNYIFCQRRKKDICWFKEKTSTNHPVWLTDCNWKIEMSFGTSKHTKWCSIHSEHNVFFFSFLLCSFYFTCDRPSSALALCYAPLYTFRCIALSVFEYKPFSWLFVVYVVCMRVWFSSITAHSHIRRAFKCMR